MLNLKYTIIKSREQYNQYCSTLEDLLSQDNENLEDEIELITVLIEKWDNDNNILSDSDPIETLKYLMESQNMKARDLVEILELSKGTVSKILNYHKGLSKDTIRKLSDYFKVSQEAFNRPYKLSQKIESRFGNPGLTKKTKSKV